MDDPNRLTLDLVDEAIDFADELRVGVRHLESEAAVLDFGVDHPGGLEAGVLLAELSTGGLATVQAGLADVDGAALPQVELSTDHPELVLAGCQVSSWTIETDGVTTRVRGPAQLLRDGADGLPVGADDPDFAVLVVEADRHPDDAIVEAVATAAGVPTSGVFVAVAPAASVAGAVSASARAASTAVSRLDSLGYDLGVIQSAAGAAPVPPTAGSEPAARARSAGAIAYGGRVHLVLEDDVDEPGRLVYGHTGAEERPPVEHASQAGGRLEDVLVPAQVTLDVVGGPTHVAGGVQESLLAEQLGV